MKLGQFPSTTHNIDTSPIAPALFTEKEKKTFEESFDPREYTRTYYPLLPDAVQFFLDSGIVSQDRSKNSRMDLRQMVKKFNVPLEVAENIAVLDFQKAIAKRLLLEYPQNTLNILDVGGGPTIYQHIAISLQADNITHSEFLEKNRKEVIAWLNNEEDAYNWDGYFDLIKTMFRRDEEYQHILNERLKSEDERARNYAALIKNLIVGDTENFKAHLRKKLRQHVVYGDVFAPDLGLPHGNPCDIASQEQADSIEMLTSNFAMESATGDKTTWEQGMKNITAKIKAGGFFALTAIRNAKWYAVGKEKMPAVQVNEEILKEILGREGFEIVEMRVLEGSDQESVGYDGMVFIFAQKKK